MVFSSPLFLFLFLPLTLVAYYSAPGRARNGVLLGASWIFYAWGELGYVGLMVASSFLNWAIGLRVGKKDAMPPKRRAWLALGVTLNLAGLVYFKYAGFLLGIFEEGPDAVGIHLPLGISFFTFQAIAYLVDVYRREVEACRRPFDLALYISLFPQLIAGPIVRFGEVAQALRDRKVQVENLASGIQLFVVGLSKKLLLANPIGEVAAALLGGPDLPSSAPYAWLGAFAFALQIYFDFSGYTDMARGLGRMFGFAFPENFRFPYASRTVREFWRRWHMTLSSWFRDYVYIPLGGNRRGSVRTAFNLASVFLLCGLWHGASWTFVAWGAAHGLWMVGERCIGLREPKRRVGSIGGWLLTTVFLLHSWVLFASPSIGYAVDYWGKMWLGGSSLKLARADQAVLLDLRFFLCLGVASALALNAHGWVWNALRSGFHGRSRSSVWAEGSRFSVFVLLLLLCLLRLSAQDYSPFLYFRF